MNVSLTISLPNSILEELDEVCAEDEIARSEFIAAALPARFKLRKQFRRESALTAEESMKVLHEFEAIDDVPD